MNIIRLQSCVCGTCFKNFVRRENDPWSCKSCRDLNRRTDEFFEWLRESLDSRKLKEGGNP